MQKEDSIRRMTPKEFYDWIVSMEFPQPSSFSDGICPADYRVICSVLGITKSPLYGYLNGKYPIPSHIRKRTWDLSVMRRIVKRGRLVPIDILDMQTILGMPYIERKPDLKWR
jgi:hypothetical protein